MLMERWLLEFPATMRKASLTLDKGCARTAMHALSQHYQAKSTEERLAIYLSLSRTILEDLDKGKFRQVEEFLLDIGLLQKQKA